MDLRLKAKKPLASNAATAIGRATVKSPAAQGLSFRRLGHRRDALRELEAVSVAIAAVDVHTPVKHPCDEKLPQAPGLPVALDLVNQVVDQATVSV